MKYVILSLLLCCAAFSETRPMHPGSGREQKTILLQDKIPLELVWITASPETFFEMGVDRTPENEMYIDTDETPQHKVYITQGFWMSKYELTQLQWKTVMGDNPSSQKSDYLPVYNVSWIEAHVFIKRLNRMGIGVFRLPTEAEWEYVAYYGGIDILEDKSNHVWYDENSSSTPHETGRKKADAWGLHDQIGNVYEWTEDWYSPIYYLKSPAIDPLNREMIVPVKVYRGGCYNSSIKDCRITRRYKGSNKSKIPNVGLRIILEPYESEK